MTALTITAKNISASELRQGSFIEWYTAGEDITLGAAVRLDSSNVAYLAIATSADNARAIGLAVYADNQYAGTTIYTGGQVGVLRNGPVYGFTGLTAGQQFWVDKTTAGALNDTAPTTAYQWVMGQAVDDQTIYIEPGTTAPASA